MTIQVKKSLQAIYDVLQANNNRKVSSVLAEIEHLFIAKSKSAGTGASHEQATLKDADGKVVAIKCYYFKRWMPLLGERAVEVGTKANSNTGLNTMCKEGVNLWTKQNREAKQALNNLLAQVEQGEISPAEIADAKAKIEQDRKRIQDTELGFESLEEVTGYLANEGVQFITGELVEAE